MNGVLVKRFEHFRGRMEKQLMHDVHNLELSRYAFLDDLELATVVHNGRHLTRREQRIARGWETSKKEVPMVLLAAHERVVNMMRSQAETKAISINVERAVIRMPDTKPEQDEDAIIIDAEVG